MSDVGSQLRKAREERGLSLEQVQKATRIKRVFLEAIEADEFEALPGPVQARGFVRSYASHLGLDPDTLLSPSENTSPKAPATTPRRSPEATQVPTPTRPPTARAESSLPLPLPILIVGVIVLFVIGGILLLQAFRGEAPAPTPEASANVPLAMSQTPAPTSTGPAPTRVSLTLSPIEHVWVRITYDGITAFEGMLEPGAAQTWEAEQQIIVETGNGGALNAKVNGEDIGLLGPRNRVVVRAWGIEGEVTPAPTAMPAPPEPSATPES